MVNATETGLPDSLPERPPAGLEGWGVRLATPGDLESLHAACYPDRPPARFGDAYRRLMRWQAAGRAWVFVVERSDPAAIVASGRLIRRGGAGEIADLAVVAGQRGRGVGTALIALMTAVARQAGLSRLEIGAAAGNTRALALYRRLGFEEDRRVRLPGWLPGGELAVILSKEL